MCMVSMVYRYGTDELQKFVPPSITPQWPNPFAPPAPDVEDLKRRVAELEKMLKAATEYDKATGQPDCDDAEKLETLKKLAEQLGVPISFPA